jgi:predicted PolB exonuclease-like 3'-5' exonuclease
VQVISREDVHATGEGMNNFPTSEWSSYPCTSHGTKNHDVEKYPRRKSMQLNPYKKKEDHFSSQRKRRNDKKGSWNKMLCYYCGKSGHQIEKCWTLYSHLCLKKNRKYVKTLVRIQVTSPCEVNDLTERLGK